MKTTTTVLCALMLAFALTNCGKSSHDHDHNDHDHDHDAAAADDNGALYDKVMELHDEGMARMDKIEKLKRTLKDRISSAEDLVPEKKEQIEAAILKLDSAGKGMMTWMHEFQPETDSLDEEAYREYLETEMERVRKVKDDIFEAIERAEAVE